MIIYGCVANFVSTPRNRSETLVPTIENYPSFTNWFCESGIIAKLSTQKNIGIDKRLNGNSNSPSGLTGAVSPARSHWLTIRTFLESASILFCTAEAYKAVMSAADKLALAS